jgi:AraC-like DNA-binding protein
MTELFDDIKSLYRFKAPCDELKNYIEFFSESCFESTKKIVSDKSFSIKMFQSWTPTFWINLGPSYNLVLNGITYRINENSAIAVARNVTAERLNQPSDHLFTIKFYPGALKHLLGVDQNKLNTGCIELNEIIPHYLISKIKLSKNLEQRVYLTEQFFLQKLAGKKLTDHYTNLVTQTIASYNENGIEFKVKELSAKTFTSSRTLRRYFDRVIGISPKQYIDSVRIRKALYSFLKDKNGFDPGSYGYYDMSHFYRNVIRFTGRRIADQQ